jgi:hypothetical protein
MNRCSTAAFKMTRTTIFVKLAIKATAASGSAILNFESSKSSTSQIARAGNPLPLLFPASHAAKS